MSIPGLLLLFLIGSVNFAHGRAPGAPGGTKLSPESGGFSLQERRKTVGKEKGPTPCEQARRDIVSQLGIKKGATQDIFLPICDQRDGSMYKRLQCRVSIGACWCVDIVTGDPVAEECEGSTATVQIKSAGPLIAKRRDIKRCTKPEKLARFYKKLFATFKEEQKADQNVEIELLESHSISLKETKQRSRIKQAVLWKFRSLDKNGNELLERSEWRGYRKAIRMWQGVRTCARNFFRFCDADLNKKITPEEWQDCTFPYIDLLDKKQTPLNPFLNELLLEDRH